MRRAPVLLLAILSIAILAAPVRAAAEGPTLQPLVAAGSSRMADGVLTVPGHGHLLLRAFTSSGALTSFTYAFDANAPAELVDVPGETASATVAVPSDDGLHQLHERAVDDAGRIATRDFTIRVDASAPAVAFASPAPGKLYSSAFDVDGHSWTFHQDLTGSPSLILPVAADTHGKTVFLHEAATAEFTVNASDVAGVDEVVYYLDHVGSGQDSMCTTFRSPYSCFHDFTADPKGDHEVIAVATDAFGYSSQTSFPFSFWEAGDPSTAPTFTVG